MAEEQEKKQAGQAAEEEQEQEQKKTAEEEQPQEKKAAKHKSAPVSYTHLDVYKRQAMNLKPVNTLRSSTP